jgi:hypothetical protein
MKTGIAALTFALLGTVAVVAHASTVNITNEDDKSYKILISTDDHCFSGLHTSINGHTQTTIEVGYLCMNEQKPGFKLEEGKSYVIKNGAVAPK